MARELIWNVYDYHDQSITDVFELLSNRIETQPENLLFTLIFLLAVIHSFVAPLLLKAASKRIRRHEMPIDPVAGGSKSEIPKRTGHFSKETFFWEMVYFFGEIEVVFGLWAIPLLLSMVWFFDWDTPVAYIKSNHYTEAAYLFVSMAIAATYPVIRFVEQVSEKVMGWFEDTPLTWWMTLLTLGPLFASYLKDTSMMTIVAILLMRHFYIFRPPLKLALATQSLLFVNMGVAGSLTSVASPTALLVSGPWGWDTGFMFFTFGWKAMVGIITVNVVYWFLFRESFAALNRKAKTMFLQKVEVVDVPFWVTGVHLAFLVWVILTNNEPALYLGAFVLFLGFYQATHPYQIALSLRVPILIAFFVASLELHASLQGWWAEAFLESFKEQVLPFVALVLTTICHNSMVVYLATFVPHLTDRAKEAYFSGAIAASGLTLISSGANLIGYKVLSQAFDEPIAPSTIFIYSFLPTFIMLAIFLYL